MSLRRSVSKKINWFVMLKNKFKNKAKNNISNIRNIFYYKNSQLFFDSYNEGQIKCSWFFSKGDQKTIKDKSIYCLGIRIADITKFDTTNQRTCIMKEIEVNKNLNSTCFYSPINDGKILLEVGYRSFDGKWNTLSTTLCDLGIRNQVDILYDDSWFYISDPSRQVPDSLHERIFQLSNSRNIGGSERISNRNKR